MIQKIRGGIDNEKSSSFFIIIFLFGKYINYKMDKY